MAATTNRRSGSSADHQLVGVTGARAEALGAIDDECASGGPDGRADVERVERIPPEPGVRDRPRVSRPPLRRSAEQAGSGEEQVVEAEEVRQGAVGAGQ
jgi:hypothetical protein